MEHILLKRWTISLVGLIFMKLLRNKIIKELHFSLRLLPWVPFSYSSFLLQIFLLKNKFLRIQEKITKVAFYAADSGLECALYHDIKKPGFYFATSTNFSSGGNRVQWFYCITLLPSTPAPTPIATTTFSFNMIGLDGTKSCSIVKVVKSTVGPDIHTKISAMGLQQYMWCECCHCWWR